METITIKDVAKLCGVGVSTVSRAINNHPDINAETKEMILEVIREHNYIPNNSARNLKRTDSKSIAVLVKGISNPFFSDVIKVLEKEIKKKKCSMILHRVDYNEDEVDVALELVKEKRLRGFVFLGGYFMHAPEKLRQLPVPFVLGTTGVVKDEQNLELYSSVSVDDEKESFRMTEFLCRTGHKHIAILCAKEGDCSIGKLRLDGYLRALRTYQLPYEEGLVLHMKEELEDYSAENGYVLTKELLTSGIPCDAIFAISDSMAMGACRALMEAGKKIPEDYSVAGFDGIQMGKYYCPAITTITQPTEQMAGRMADILFKVISKKECHKHIVLPAELTIRESVRVPAGKSG